MQTRTLRLALLALAVGLASGMPWSSQGAPRGAAEESEDETFFETVDVHVVNVEVYVTDKQGRPVTGLGQEDFELYEDGEPVPISNFFAVADEAAILPPTVEGPRAETGSAEPTAPAPAPSPADDPRRLHLVLYVDQLSLTPPHRNRVLRGLELFLEERLTEGDLLTVVSSHPSFEIVVPFTDDREEILSALRELETRVTDSVAQEHNVLERRIVSGASSPNADLLAEVLLNDIRHFAERSRQRLRNELIKLRSFTGSLEGLPGRKAVVHLSEGVPLQPGEDLFALWAASFLGDAAAAAGAPSAGDSDFGGSFQEASRYDLSGDFERLVRTANAAGVTFYTLDTYGSRATSSASAEFRGLSSQGERVGGVEAEAVAGMVAQEGLQRLAGGTGGVPILNANRPWVNLESVAQTFDSYYSLGYTPSDPQSGKYHRLEVKVRRPGVKVRHRQGYAALTRSERIENASVAALLLQQWRNPLRIFLEVGDPEPVPGKGKRFQVAVDVKVPLGRVTLLPGPGSHRGLLRVRLAFQGENGFGVGDEMTVPIEVPANRLAAAREQHFTVTVPVQLDKGLHRLAVTVWDEVGAEASFLPYDLQVGERQGG